ncbi:FAD binding domain-containing protein [Colletotrichum truncatum]|uniref:FAD binding domain-containing protein n=1 Tax=Colletotrichum truncatum TaxID=5467 RepID=A0ACC3YTJ4_COLTU|nr:FAD binding domain-containing protein [Colletotrichum truncatum]KAF6799190.1 FAD binding domain-containing protein [Colletotrichum truncatum]
MAQHDPTSLNCQKACSILHSEFGPTAVHYYGQDNFTLWDAKQNEVQYACRFEPSNKTDVAAALRVLTGSWCNFAIKCGGHSRDPDFSNSVGGVTIDMRRLNSVEVATNGSFARIGGGAVTADVYSALDARNLSFVGGRVGSVGVGGFTTGGGTSPLSARHGWAVDNVYEYELVLANATFVTVNEHQHPELYWALRGAGGGNFGVITSFVVRTSPQGQLYSGSRIWNDTNTEQVVNEVYDLFTSQDHNTNVSVDFYYAYAPARDVFTPVGSLRYFDPVESPPVFASIDRIPVVTSSGQISSLGDTSGPGNVPAAPPPTRHLFQTMTTFPSREWLQESLQIFREEVRAFKSVEGLNPQIITYPIPSRAIRGMTDRGGNALGLGDVPGPLLITFLSTAWLRAEDDALVGDFYDRVFARLEDASRRLSIHHPYKYIGYGRLGEDIFSSYGADNRERLVQVQEDVDPKGIFTSGGLCRGGFKIR